MGGIRYLLRYLTFAEEAPMAGEQTAGGDEYMKAFQANRRETADGRSPKDLDMKDRLLKHRISWMIYSKAFDGMPLATRQEVYFQLHNILNAPNAPEGFEHLEPAEKQALTEILRETKPELAEAWKTMDS